MDKSFVRGKALWWLIASLVLGYALTIGLFNYPLDPGGMSKRRIAYMVALYLVSVVLVFMIGKTIFPLMLRYSLKTRLVWGLAALAAGLVLVLVIPLQPERLTLQDTTAGGWWLYLPDVVWISFLIFCCSVWLVVRPAQIVEPERFPRAMIFIYALPLFATWSVYLLAYWPGGMSPDSMDQWNQMISFKFVDWHPVFHTLTNWLITRLWLSPAAIALVQIITLSLVLGWGLSLLRRFGAPRWLPWLVLAFFIITPSTGLMVIMLWKDVFYSVAVVALTMLVFEIVVTEGEWIQEGAGWAYLGILAALVALYRQNGPATAFGTLVCLVILYRKVWKRLTVALLLALVLWGGVRGPVYAWLGVNQSPLSSVELALAHVLARYTNSDTPIAPAERALLLKIRPEASWPYDCYMETPLYYDGKFNFTGKLDGDLEMLTATLIYRNPNVFLDQMVCNGSFIYRITQPPGSKYETVAPFIIPNRLGLASESKLPEVKTILDRWEAESRLGLDWLFWRVPAWGYLLLASIIIHALRSKNWKVVAVLVPVAANMLPLGVVTIGQIFRYVFPTLLVGVLMSGYFLFGGVVEQEAKQDL